MSLHYDLVSFQYREYENGLLRCSKSEVRQKYKRNHKISKILLPHSPSTGCHFAEVKSNDEPFGLNKFLHLICFLALDYINVFTSGSWWAPASMAEWRMTLRRLTFAGERSRSAIICWGAPKMCPVLERSCLTNHNKNITLTKALYVYDRLTRVFSITISFHDYLLASWLFWTKL